MKSFDVADIRKQTLKKYLITPPHTSFSLINKDQSCVAVRSSQGQRTDLIRAVFITAESSFIPGTWPIEKVRRLFVDLMFVFCSLCR